MNNHTYLRAYLAGVLFPTLVFPVLITLLLAGKLVTQEPIPVERIVIFPLAFVPCLWGLWNMLWAASHNRTHLPLGVHGAILPLLLLPMGASLAKCLGVITLGQSVKWTNEHLDHHALYIHMKRDRLGKALKDPSASAASY